MGLYFDRAAELGAMIREAGKQAEAKRCNDRNGAERAAQAVETPEQVIARYTAGWSPCRLSAGLRASLNLPDPDPMEKSA